MTQMNNEVCLKIAQKLMNLWISASGPFHFMEMKGCLCGREGEGNIHLDVFATRYYFFPLFPQPYIYSTCKTQCDDN